MDTIANIIGIIIGIICIALPFVLILAAAILNLVSGKAIQKKYRERSDALLKSVLENGVPEGEEPVPEFREPAPDEVPATPIILVGRNGHVDLIPKDGLEPVHRATMLGLLNDDRDDYYRYYAADGRVWRQVITSPRPKPTVLKKLLANTVYNPLLDYEVGWRCERSYAFYELREMLYLCVEADDDILTQYIEDGRLIKLIRKAKNFHHLFNTMNRVLNGPQQKTPQAGK